MGGLGAENVAKWNAIRGSVHVLQRCLKAYRYFNATLNVRSA